MAMRTRFLSIPALGDPSARPLASHAAQIPSLPVSHFSSSCCSSTRVRVNPVWDVPKSKSSLKSLFCYENSVPVEDKPLSLSRRDIGREAPCISCDAKGAVLCVTCSGSGLYIDSILESQGIIVKVRCLGCGGTGNTMCSACGGRGHGIAWEGHL